MTVLISIVLGLLLAAFTALALLGLVLQLIVLALLILLAADILLERNGVDRRTIVQRAWRNLRASSSAAERTEGAEPTRAPRTPFSARRPPNPAAPVPPAERTPPPTAAGPAAQGAPAGSVQVPAPAPVAHDDAPTAVLPVGDVQRADTEARGARRATTSRSTSTPRRPAARVVRDPTPPPAPPTAAPPGTAPTEPQVRANPTGPVDRDSAIDRLFAPLIESDSTEPLPAARAGRPRRSSAPRTDRTD